jgi:hypothetical protein
MFMLPFDDSDDEEGHNSDFKNSFEPEVEDKLDLNKEILLFKDNNLDLDSEPKELPPVNILPDYSPSPPLKLRVIYNIRTRI